MLSYFKRKYLNGIGSSKLEEIIDENYFDKEKSHNSSSEHKSNSHSSTSSYDEVLTKSNNSIIVDSESNKLYNNIDTNSASPIQSFIPSPIRLSDDKISINSNHINSSPKVIENEKLNVSKKSISPVKPEYKKLPSSISNIDYKKPSSSVSSNTNTDSTINTIVRRNVVKRSSHSSVKKTEIPKKSLNRNSISGLNSLKKTNSQGQFKSTIKKNETLTRITSPVISAKKKENSTIVTVTNTISNIPKKQTNSSLASKKSSSLTPKKLNTVPLSASAIAFNKKKEDTKVPSTLKTLKKDTQSSNLYEITPNNSYKKLNETTISTAHDAKVKRNSLILQTKISRTGGELKRSATIDSKPTKVEGSGKRSLTNFKEEQKISERLDNLKKTYNSYPVIKTSTLANTIKEDKNSNVTSEKKNFPASRLEDINRGIVNNAIENRNKRNSITTINKEKRTSVSSLKTGMEPKERKGYNTMASVNKERSNSISNSSTITLVNKERSNSISNSSTITFVNKERSSSLSNSSTITFVNKERSSSLNSSYMTTPINKERSNSLSSSSVTTPINKERSSSLSNSSMTTPVNKERSSSLSSPSMTTPFNKERSSSLSSPSMTNPFNKERSSSISSSVTLQNSQFPLKIVSKDKKFSSITPKNSLLFSTENRIKDDLSKEEKTLTITEPLTVTEPITDNITETITEMDSILSNSSIDTIESISSPSPKFSKSIINTFSDQVSEFTLAQNTEEVGSPHLSNFTSPTLNSSRKGSFVASSPALSSLNMSSISSSGLKKKRTGWWDNIKDKNEEKQFIKDSIRSLPVVDIKAEEPENTTIDMNKVPTNKFNFALHKNSSVDSIHLSHLSQNKFMPPFINDSKNKIITSTPLIQPQKLDGPKENLKEDSYKKSMNEIELLMNKAKLTNHNESIINALDIIIDFCKENGFNRTINTLKEEANYYSNSENTNNLKEYFENRSFDLAINYVKTMFSKYKPEDIPNYDEIEKGYHDMLYVLYRYNYINLIQKRKKNDARIKILNVFIKKRVNNSCVIGGQCQKYFEDDYHYLSELLVPGPLSRQNPYKSFTMKNHLKQFWLESYAEMEFLNYWQFLEMFFNHDTKEDSSTFRNHTSIPLANLIKFTKAVQEIIDIIINYSNRNGTINANDTASIKNYDISTPVMTPVINDIPKEYPSAPLKHSTVKTEIKHSRKSSNDSFKSTNSLRSRLLRESSKNSINLSNTLPLCLTHKTSNSSMGSDVYGNSSLKSVTVSSIGNGRTKTTTKNSSIGLTKHISLVFDEEATSNSKPIVRLSRTRLKNMRRSSSAFGNYSTNYKRNSMELNDYRVNPRYSFHCGDIQNYGFSPLTHYANSDVNADVDADHDNNNDNDNDIDNDSISYNTFSDNSIYSLTSCDWLNFVFEGFIGPYAGGIRAMDVQYTAKKDSEGHAIDSVFGQLVVAVAIDSIQDHSISIWDVHSKTCLASILNTNSSGNTKAVEIIKFHPTLPNVFLTSDQDFDVKLWDWTQGSMDVNGHYHIEPIRIWKKFHKRIIHKMDFLPNNPLYAISCSSDNTIQIWNINDEGEGEDNKMNVKRIVSNNPISSFTFANNNRYLVAASMYILRIYDAENYKLLNTIELEDLKSSKMTINSMETHITNDNLLLLSCASHIILYDLETTSGIRVFDSPFISQDQKIEGHFSPYGQYIYSGSIIPKYFASLPTTDYSPNISTIYPNTNYTGSNNNNNNSGGGSSSTCSNTVVNTFNLKDKEGTGFYLWNVDSGRFELSSIQQMEKDVEPYLSSNEKVTVCQWVNIPCKNDPDTNAQIFIFGTTDKVLRFYSYCDCHLTS
ncbi:WD40 repeat-like protein [Neocallimastix lanati (nom. inval.)]|nr:WD40 repeat-like protein [Neocallimastix sp. JGI-2020a]